MQTSNPMEAILNKLQDARNNGEKMFDFTLSNPNLGVSHAMKSILISVVDSARNEDFGYAPSQGLLSTRQTIADDLNQQAQRSWFVTEQDITIVPGAAGGLCALFKVLLQQGDEVIGVKPYFPSYTHYIENAGAHYVPVDAHKDFALNIDNVIAAINEKTKVILLNSPNNPSGVIYSAEQLALLAQKLTELAQHGQKIDVISDEAYARVTYDSASVPSIIDFYEHSIRVVSFSKDLGLAGIRIGYIETTPHYRMLKLQDKLGAMIRNLGFVNTSTLAQKALLKGLNETVSIEYYQAQKDQIVAILDVLNISYCAPKGGLFLLAKSPIDDSGLWISTLLKHGVAVVPGSLYGAPAYFRISTTIDEQQINASKDSWKAALAELSC